MTRFASLLWFGVSILVPLVSLMVLPAQAGLDLNGNNQSDVWEAAFSAAGLVGSVDSDGDGYDNASEAAAGTDPLDPSLHPTLTLGSTAGIATLGWPTTAWKSYTLWGNDTLDPAGWEELAEIPGTGGWMEAAPTLLGGVGFFRLTVTDSDADADGLTDWEERMLGFDPQTAHTERYNTEDHDRVTAAWNAPSVISAALIDGEMSERWPDPGVIAIRRSGGMKPVTVNFQLAGSATQGADYLPTASTSVTIPAGSREVWVEFTPVADADEGETSETIIVTIQPGAGYSLGAALSATVNLANEVEGGPPGPEAAARFLIQAAFGPDQDAADDQDFIPENVETVMALGFEGWIDEQFALPVTKLQPFVDVAGSIPQFYVDPKVAAWWNRAMGVPWEVPDGPPVAYDVLRQRVAYCLSQIVVVSDRPETLAVQPSGMANYYDTILSHAFGNYRDLLYNVTLHPVMGFYLSALKNQKPDPINNIFPDENYAREIMQLFGIGLWEVNPDGTRQQDAQGKDIPTYDNTTITNFARVFTGMSYGGGSSFLYAQPDWTTPMKMWDAYHDTGAKTLLNGAVLLASVPSDPDTGATGLADINAAIDNIFQHPNVGPFLGRQLIQRMVTSNPSPGYVGRVAAAFADNGSGVRGDMKAVIKAILLDPDARDPARMSDPHFGKMREPFLRVVNLARAFDAAAVDGFYQVGSFFMDHYEEPMKSPSVFNFYLPGYTPPGEIQAAGLVAPEFQILNATSAISAPNYYYRTVFGGIHRWGSADPDRTVLLKLTQELALVNDVDALLRRLDAVLTYGQLPPRQFQIIREAVLRISPATWDWQNERVRLAIYLIVTSPEYCILR